MQSIELRMDQVTHLRQYEVRELVLPRSVRGLRRNRKTWHDNLRQVRHRPSLNLQELRFDNF